MPIKNVFIKQKLSNNFEIQNIIDIFAAEKLNRMMRGGDE